MSETLDPLFGLSQRLPPANTQAEQALLGGLLANNQSYERVAGFLRAEHFSDPIHARIYQAIVRRIDAGQLADAVTLKAEFENSGILEVVGGTAYLAQLLTAMVSPMMAGEYGRAVHDCWIRRQLIELGTAVVNNAFGADPELDGAAQVYTTQDQLALLVDETNTTTTKRGNKLLSDMVTAAFERAGAIHRGDIPPPASTGIAAVDQVLGGGFAPKTLTYLLGLGEMGKTELAMQIAESVAAEAMAAWRACGEKGPAPGVLYISLGDMDAQQIGLRSAARLAGIRSRKLRRGELDEDTLRRAVDAERIALSMPVEISDEGPRTLARVGGDLRRFTRRRPCALCIVDNASNIASNSKSKDSLYFQYISLTASLKDLAMQLGVPVMLLMHLSQSVATRDNPTPRKGDIPWGTEKDADGAIGMWRPIMRLSAKPPERGGMKEEAWLKRVDDWHRERAALQNVTELVPLKARENDGDAPAIVKLIFDRETHRFREPGFSDLKQQDMSDHAEAPI